MRDALVDALSLLPALDLTVADCAAAPVRPSRPPGMAGTPVPRIDSLRARPGESAPDFVARVAPTFDRVWVTAPESDEMLATLCECVGPRRWLGCTPDAIRVASSKSATLAQLARHAIPTPLNPAASPNPNGSAAPSSQTAPAHSPDWVVKPDDGAGSEDTRIFADLAQARTWQAAQREAGRKFTLEPWIEGAPMSLSLACTDAHCTLLAINQQSIAVANGELRYLGVHANAEPLDTPAAIDLAALARRIHRALPGLRGFVGVDLVRRADGTPVVIEINPRLTCAFEGLPEGARLRAIRAAIEAQSSPRA